MKRLVSLLTAVLFLFTMLPVGALADGAGTFTVKDSLGAELEENDIIDTVEGVLTLVVGNASEVDLDGIAISDYNGAVVATKKSDTEIEVKFGRLAEGEHTLTVGAVEFTFTAEKKYHTNTDFEDYTDSNIATELENDNLSLIYPTYAEAGGTAYAKVKSFTSGSSAGKKYIGLSPANGTGFTSNKWLGMVVDGKNFNNTTDVNEDKVYVLDVSYYRNKNHGYGFGALSDGTDRINKNASTLLASQNAAYSNNLSVSTGLALKGTLYWPRMVLVRDGSDLRQDLYDFGGNAANPYIGSNKNKVSAATEVNQLTVLGFNSYLASATNEMQIASVKCYPERLLSILKVGAFDYNTNKVILHMSDDVKGTADAIIVTKGEDEVTGYDVELDNDTRTITLTFTDGLDAGTYTVDISGLCSTNDLKAYTATSEFIVLADADKPPVAQPVVTDYLGNELEDNGTIRTIDGELTLTFESAIDADTIDAIEISGGVKGEIVKEVNGNVVTINFGRLDEDTDYTLSVPLDVMTTDGRNVTALELGFTAVKAYHTNADFEDYTDSNIATELENDNLSLIYPSYAEAGGTAYAKVKSFTSGSSAGKKYIGLSPANGTGFTASKWLGMVVDGKNFNNTTDVNEDKVYVLDVSYYRNQNHAYGFGALSDGTDRINKNASTLLASKNAAYSNNLSVSTGLALKGTLYWPRMVLVRDGSDLRQDLYDFGGNAANPYIGSNKNKVSAATEVNQLTVLGFNSYSADATNEMQIASVKCYPDMLPSVLTTNHAGNTAVFHMSDDIDEDTLSAIVVKKNDEAVTEGVSTSYADRTITVTLPEGTDTYTIDMSAVQSTVGLRVYSADAIQAYGKCSVSDVVFKDASGNEITDAAALAAANVVGVTANIVNAGEDTVAYLAVYGKDDAGNNKLIDVVEATITDGVVSAATKEFTPGVVTQAKLFVWESISTLTPLVTAKQCLQ